MGNVIRIADKRKRVKQMRQMMTNVRREFTGLVDRLTYYEEGCKSYTPREAAKIADEILDLSDCLGYQHCMETPIEAIINAFGVKVFGTEDLDNSISGVIYANGTTRDCYGHDIIIVTDVREPFGHQRFVAAHELGHYLFDCLGNSKYRDKGQLFKEQYPKRDHDFDKEIRADRFAAELLMPRDLFKEQYNEALEDRTYNPSGSLLFVMEYLAQYFKVKKSAVQKRICEVFYDGGF